MNTRRQRMLAAASALGGLVLFTYAVRSAGVANIIDGVRRVGWGLIAILLLTGVRYALRTEAWRLCVPAALRLPRRHALTAFLAGDAVGVITPLGLAASEPTKVLLVRHHLATRQSVASLAIDNVVYSASVLVMIAFGLTVLLEAVPLHHNAQRAVVASLIGIVLFTVAAAVVIRRGLRNDGSGESRVARRLATLRAAVQEFSAGAPSRLWGAFALDLLFHGVAVAEAYVTLLWLLGPAAATVTDAVLFEGVNRIVTVLFKFVPFRVGVDEAASGALAPLLALNPAAGVSVAVIRKVRSLFWAGCGLALIGLHHAPAAPATDRPGTVPAHRT